MMKPIRLPFLLSILLLAMGWIVYGQSVHFGFFNYDDYDYLFHTPFLQQPWSAEVVSQIFSYMGTGNWHPLIWLSLKVDGDLFSQDPFGYHFTNVILHLLNGLMLFGILKKWTGSLWKSFFVAALFLVHPHRAESVAWIVERKDVLSGFFFMLTLWAYSLYAKPTLKRFKGASAFMYVLALVFFLLGLLSKSMLMTTPFILLLLDYWPFRRLQDGFGTKEGGRCRDEKLPFFVLMVVVAFMAIYSRAEVSLGINAEVSFISRILNSFVFYAYYIRDSLFPFSLAFYRLYPSEGIHWLTISLSCGLVVLITLAAFLYRKIQPSLFVGWFWFVGMLVPVIGVLHVGYSAYPDRYTYLPSIGLWIAIVWVVSALFGVDQEKNDRTRKLIAPISVIMLATFMLLGWRQVSLWESSEKVYRHTLKIEPHNFHIHEALCDYLNDEARVEEAIQVCQDAVEKFPDRAHASRTLGRIFFKKKAYSRAKEHLLRMLDITMKHRYQDDSLAEDKIEKRLDEFNFLMKSIITRKEAENSFYVLGNFWTKNKFYRLAVDSYRAALRVSPSHPQAHVNLANVYFLNGKIEMAKQHFEVAMQLNPEDINAHFNYGVLYESLGQYDPAKELYEATLNLDSRHQGAIKRLKKVRGK